MSVRHVHRHDRRGTALLLVLACLVVVTVAAATLASTAATARLTRAVSDQNAVASDLARVAESAIESWLATASARVALSPEAMTPEIVILQRTLLAPHDGRGGRDAKDDQTVWLSVRAFDQCGMVPARASKGSPLNFALPESLIEPGDTLARRQGAIGIDQIDPAALGGRRLFPVGTFSPDPSAMSDESAVAALIATHAPWPPAINVNTAPKELLEAAYRAAGRGGSESVLASRAEGKPAAAPASPARRSDRGEHQVRLIGSSSAWAFRIDIRVGIVRRSWWSVFVLGSSGWRCAQRVSIED